MSRPIVVTACILAPPNHGGLEVLVLEVGFREGGETYGPQSWLRLPIGTHFSARVATDGCRVWIKEGHLRHVPAVRPTGEGGEESVASSIEEGSTTGRLPSRSVRAPGEWRFDTREEANESPG